jgi:hypothetical protein
MLRSGLLLLGSLLTSVALSACAAVPSGDGSSDALPLTADAHVRFASNAWEPAWVGTPHAGGRLVIDYDFARLPACRNQSHVTSWVVDVHWRFDGGEVHTEALAGSPGTGETLVDSAIVLPRDARSIELWFENRAVGGYDHCQAWDSRYGANYGHSVD